MVENRLSLFLAWELCVWLQKPFLVEFNLKFLLFISLRPCTLCNIMCAMPGKVSVHVFQAGHCTWLCTSWTVQLVIQIADFKQGAHMAEYKGKVYIYWSGTVEVAWTPSLSHDSDVRRSTCQNSPSMAAPQNVHEFFVFDEISLTQLCGTWEQGFISWSKTF